MGQVIGTSTYSTRKWVQEWHNITLRRIPGPGSHKVYIHIEEINPEYSLEKLILKLKLQYIGHPMQKANSLEKTLMLRKIEVRRRRGLQRMRWFDDISDLIDMSLSKLQEMVKDREAWRVVVCGVAKSWTRWATEQHRTYGCNLIITLLSLTLMITFSNSLPLVTWGSSTNF